MANEFIIRKGYKSLASSEVTGSLTLIGDYESIRALTINSTKGSGTEHYFRTHGVNGDTLSIYSSGNRVFSLDSNSIDILGSISGSTYYGDGSNLTGITIPYSSLTGTVPTWNQNTTGLAAQATNLNATDDRDIAPEDLSYSDDLRIFFAEKAGIEGNTVAADYQDLLVLNSYSDSSGGKMNALAFDKSTYRLLHYNANPTATNWGTPKQLAYTDSTVANATSASYAETGPFLSSLSGAVLTTGNQTVAGTKTFTSDIRIEHGGPTLVLKDTTDDDDQSIVFENNAGTTEYKIGTQDITGGGAGDGFSLGSISNNSLFLATANTTALTIDTSQNATFVGDVTVAGTLTAQEFHSEFVSASIIYESGSTKFGDTSDDNHDFTGSLNISGSLSVDGTVPTWNQDTTGNADTATTASYVSNADTVDNVHASSFLRSDAADTATGLLTLNGGVHILSGTGGGKLRIKRNSGSTDGDDITDIHMDDGGIYFDIDNDNDGDSGNVTFRYKTNGSFTNLLQFTNTAITYKGSTIWHAGNDGPTSGLAAQTAATASYVDYSNLAGTVPTWNQNTTGTAATASYVAGGNVDGAVASATTAGSATTATTASNAMLLDGIDSTSFLRSDADDTFSGVITGNAIIRTRTGTTNPNISSATLNPNGIITSQATAFDIIQMDASNKRFRVFTGSTGAGTLNFPDVGTSNYAWTLPLESGTIALTSQLGTAETASYVALSNVDGAGTAASSAATDFVAVTGDIMTGTLILRGQADDYDGNDRAAYWDYDANVALALEPAADDGATAILFKSIGNNPSDFAYIAYDEDYPEAGVTAGEVGALILSSQNDGAGSSDHVRVKSRLVVEADMASSDPTMAFQVKSSNTTSDLFSVTRTGNIATSGDLTVSGGDITLGGTGRIQGIDTVSSGTDAANKTYVDNKVTGLTEYVAVAGDTMTGALTVTDGSTGILVDSATHASLRLDRGSTSYDSNLLFYTAGALDFRIWQDGSSDYLYVRDETGGAGNMVTFKKGGNVGIGTTNPATQLNINSGAGGASGTAALRIGGTSNYASLELGITGNYGGMIRSYGNDIHYYSGHWRTVGNTASENHSHYWYTSRSGSADWSSIKMELDHNGNLGIGTTSPSSKLEVYGSGSTVLDIQGSQGQLFSITDDLTGDLLSISDISGIPIFNVNASGDSYFDGNLDISGSLKVTGSAFFNGLIGNSPVENPGVHIGLSAGNDGSIQIVGTSAHIDFANAGSEDFDARIILEGNDELNVSGVGNNFQVDGNRVLTTADEGSGNGIDADTLDGVQASQFIRSDVDDDVTNKQLRFHSNDAIESTSGAQASLEVYQDTAGADAFMAFHVAGDYAAYFGLDGVSNDFVIGGWSKGAVKHRIFHDNYHPNADKWTSARTITLGGDLTGNVSIDGSANVTLNAQVTNNSHQHNALYENSTITYGASQLQWMDQSGTGGTGLNGSTPQNPTNDWHYHMLMNHANSNGYYVDLAFDFHDDNVWFQRNEAGTLQGWRQMFHDTYHPNADTWTTGRTITIGNTGKSVNGSANVSWTLAEIGAQAAGSYVTTNTTQTISGTKTFSGNLNIDNSTTNYISLYTENNTTNIADTFTDTSTDKSYIYFGAGDSSNDPGYIMHETSEASSPDERNEGVLHLCPSDDNGRGDYVSIHGTNDPDKIKLHTDGWIEGVSGLRVDSYISFNDNGYIRGDSSGELRLQGGTTATTFYNSSNSSELMRITQAGNVGIGDTNPDAKLTVFRTESTYAVNLGDTESRAGLSVKSSNSFDSKLTISSGASSRQYIQAVNNDATTGRDIVLNPYGGNVGIGAVSTSAKLHLYTGGLGANTGYTDMLRLELNRSDHGGTPSGPSILFKDQDTNNSTNEARISMMTVNDTDYGDNDEAASNLVFDTTNAGTSSTKMIITGRGNIGMGVTNPRQNLEVNGAIRSNTRIFVGYDSGVTNSMSCSNWFRTSGNTGIYFASYGGGVYQTDSTYVRIYASKSLQVDSTSTSSIRSQGDIVAYYSDERLKTNLGNITNAVDRVKKLNGFYYKNNELANSFGYTEDHLQIGVSAQEVESVMPEAVKPAPFDFKIKENGEGYSVSGENYKTVKYEKLVPLLIEAVKEQQNQIDELKAIVEKLQNDK